MLNRLRQTVSLFYLPHMLNYHTPKELNSIEIEVKRSRFIAYAQHIQSTADAKKFIQHLKDKYPDARHHCHAFIGGAPNNSNLYGFSDDGEPSGTAGMPIFTHLKHSGLGEVIIVVVRYFGGTKLGTGGLARAYGDAAKRVLQVLTKQEFIAMEPLYLTMSFALEARVRKEVQAIGGNVKEVAYGQEVTMTVEKPKQKLLALPYSVESSLESPI
jgi:uncharacterized YigZ family protein